MTEHISVLLIIIPLIAAPILVLSNHAKLSWIISLLVTIACAYLSFELLADVQQGNEIHYAMGGWAPPWGIEYIIDPLNALVAFIVCLIALATMVFAPKSVEREIETHQIPLFYAAFLLCFLGLVGMCLTGDIFNMFVFLEISSLASYALIGLGKNRRALTASFHYLILGTLGATFFLLGIGMLLAATGTLNMQDLANLLPAIENRPLLHTAFALIVVGMALKAAIFPMHLWLPNAYTYAPSTVSIFLSATSTKVALYALIRCLYDVFSFEYMLNSWLPQSLLLIGTVAVIYGSWLAIGQREVKKMLAYSSVAQIGYIVIGIGLLSDAGLRASLLHIFNHALMKGMLFMVAGILVYRLNSTDYRSISGMGKRMPITFGALIIGALSLIGVPGTVGFISKWNLAQAALAQQQWLVVVALLVGSLMAVIYCWKLIEVLYFQPATKSRIGKVEQGGDSVARMPVGMIIGLWSLAVLCIYFGFNTDVTLQGAQKAVDALFAAQGVTQ
ncbi:monovalent cation/H+ antiporter subunit D family protein [Alteromonas sp. ASW11-130]|uniref:monovalent cation/H+ antiporter subunit D family protein n=1 Tax=Alteromonas sp. ASW11-130 TaxID=3015775 RepID=UPI0022425210|nr:monovalent cation/H+ antiporter subunit D family protein [Alteromonas sp. ASW11-130]MCW8092761.1 monovalent cation/H+ antiporter subunit D family protein [Alteromonas sp. ASW11-130]